MPWNLVVFNGSKFPVFGLGFTKVNWHLASWNFLADYDQSQIDLFITFTLMPVFIEDF